MFQRDDMTEIESYYQIAGIHGLPFLPWNSVNQTTGGANSGYCPHGVCPLPFHLLCEHPC